MKGSKFVLSALISVLMALIGSVHAYASIPVTVDNGYRFTIRCDYEPEQQAEVRFVETINNQSPDTMTIPDMVIAYNDTFPVKRLNVIRYDRWDGDTLYRPKPKVVDFGSCSYIRIEDSWYHNYSCIFDDGLKDVIFKVPVDTLDCCFHDTDLRDVDLTNVKYLMQGSNINQGGYFYESHGIFENCKSLQSVKLSPTISTIYGGTFFTGQE